MFGLYFSGRLELIPWRFQQFESIEFRVLAKMDENFPSGSSKSAFVLGRGAKRTREGIGGQPGAERGMALHVTFCGVE